MGFTASTSGNGRKNRQRNIEAEKHNKQQQERLKESKQIETIE
jgi:hypothetical protein